MRSIFKSAELEEQFQENGYVVVDFMSEEKADQLYAYYHAEGENEFTPDYGLSFSMENYNYEKKKNVFDVLGTETNTELDHFFENYAIQTANFIVKVHDPANGLGFIPPHQDWTMCDESKGYTATVWVALTDIGRENGAMGVIPGSHKNFDGIRATPSPHYKLPYEEFQMALYPYMKVIPLKKGQALVFNNRVLHGSVPNGSDKVRVAVGMGLRHEDIQLLHYFKVPEKDPQQLAVFEVEPDFFLRFGNRNMLEIYDDKKMPENYEVDQVIDYQNDKLSEAQLMALLEEINAKKDVELTQTLEKVMGPPPKTEEHSSPEPIEEEIAVVEPVIVESTPKSVGSKTEREGLMASLKRLFGFK